jgi:hypothetical protein
MKKTFTRHDGVATTAMTQFVFDENGPVPADSLSDGIAIALQWAGDRVDANRDRNSPQIRAKYGIACLPCQRKTGY